MAELTELQEQGLFVINRYVKENRESPTRRELKELLGQKSMNGVNQILEQLQRKGYIRLEPPRKKRNIKVIRKPHKQMDLFDDEG